MRTHDITRRRFLRDLGVSAATVPFVVGLDSLYAHAQVPVVPKKRFIVMYSPNGMLYNSWRLPMAGADIDISSGAALAGPGLLLNPLQKHAAKLLILDRVSLVGARMEFQAGHPGGHQKGIGNLLTGRTLVGGNNTVVDAGLANGISIDQQLATTLFAGKVKFPSLEIGVQVDENLTDRYVDKRLSYDGPAKPRTPICDPYALFTQVFGDSSMSTAAADKRRFLDQSVLDTVVGDFQRLQTKLGTSDRQLLQLHSDSIRRIETQLTAVINTTCQATALTPPMTDRAASKRWAMLPANFPAVADMMASIMVQAVSCGLTNLVTFMWAYSETNLQYPWLPQPVLKGHHNMSHAQDPDLVKVDQWYAQQLGKTLDRMDAIPDSGGSDTLLDNSLVMWTSCLSNGAAHHSLNMPFTLAGSNGGYFRQGRCIRYNAGTDPDASSPTDASNSDLMVSILNSFGVQTDTFGDPRFVHGALPNIKK
jgi:hypothetical protein